MCIEWGGGIVQELGGPFLEVTLYDDDGGDDDDDDGDTKHYKHYHMDRLIVVSYLVFIQVDDEFMNYDSYFYEKTLFSTAIPVSCKRTLFSNYCSQYRYLLFFTLG